MILEDDVMAGYSFCEGNKEGIFLSIEDWHEQVQINLGPNVGDMTTGDKPTRSGRVNYMNIEAHKGMRMVALYEGPRPKGGLRRVDVNWLFHVTCIVC